METSLLLPILEISHHDKGKFLTFTLSNKYLGDNYQVLRSIFYTLTNNDKFNEFSNKKILITSALINGTEYGYHYNTLIDQTTDFQDFYDSVKDSKMIQNYENEYPIDVIPYFLVKVWNADILENKQIKVTRSTLTLQDKVRTSSTIANSKRIFHTSSIQNELINSYKNEELIKPYKKSNLLGVVADRFATMDIETMEYNGKQIPVAISIVNYGNSSKIFVLDRTIKIELAIKNLWFEFFNFIENESFTKTIFVHNLGSFDGYFIYKYLSMHAKPENVSTIIDQHNKFITISYTLNENDNKIVTWKDSQRIFGISLDELCNIFGVKGKINHYKKEYNNLELFKDPQLLQEFKDYCLQDSQALYNALLIAQDHYIKNYLIDITTIVSTSTLSLKILRAKFLKECIPILKTSDDKFVRDSYYGGATDYYKKYGRNLKYYDVVSLYPNAMKNPMPHEVINRYSNMDNIKLENFFGFCEAEIETPETLKPLLPCKYKGKTIFPTGSWSATYFSEELKAIVERGYKVKLIKGIEFSKAYLFNEYVDHFFHQKYISTGAQRFISKMHLNQLYGIFGRRKEIISTVNVYNKDLFKLLACKIVKSIIEIDDNLSTVLIIDNIDNDIINKLNIEVDREYVSKFKLVKNNVAISSAVTAYARIHMMDFKLNFDIYYTDTDSAILGSDLPKHLVGKELGLMKDELKGCVIKEALIFDIKKYGYWYIDENNKKIEKSVIAGVPRDSISFEDLRKLSRGELLTKELPIRFYKSFKDLNISIKPALVTIQLTNEKKLVGNTYIPHHIEKPLNINKPIEFLIRLTQRVLKKLKKTFKPLQSRHL
jgi:DNA polymerase type B, organellar and viral